MTEYFISIGVISILIAVSIAGYKLNKQLKKFYKVYQPVEELNNQLMTSLEKAEKSLENVQCFSQTVAASLQEKINQSVLLKEELSFLISRADTIANQLVDHITITSQDSTQKSVPSANTLRNTLRNIR